jgi:hypothetical protein
MAPPRSGEEARIRGSRAATERRKQYTTGATLDGVRRVAMLLVAVAMVAACAQRQPGGVAQPPEPTGATEPSPEQPGGGRDTTCETVNAGEPANFPRFVEVEVDSSGGADRITFRFEPDPSAPHKPPWHVVSFVDELITEGEGRPVEVEGEAFLLVSFQAMGVDLSTENPVEIYTGPKEFTPGFDTLKEAEWLGDFEGQVSWGLGLSRKSCFVLDASRDHITLEFPPA